VSQTPSSTPAASVQETLQSKPATPKAVVKQTPEAPAVPVSGAAPAKGVWDAVLRELINGGKRMVHACVSQGHLDSLDDKLAVIRFSVPFSKERTEKDDYRAIIEQALLKATGHTVRIQCILNEEKSQPAVPIPAQPKAIDEPPPSVKQAQEIFGGKVIKLENK
jgi:DNA polymerase-3 subunit gamma/tau